MDMLQTSRNIDLLAATIMPDHVHLLFVLGSKLSLGQVMAKMKTQARDSGRSGWHWQDDGFEHRLRPEETAEDYAFYIFMNPYRAGLLTIEQSWPWWCCPSPTLFRFASDLSAKGTPPAAWLDHVEVTARRLVTGE
jgi:REP element-mobilizing transposase RayT